MILSRWCLFVSVFSQRRTSFLFFFNDTATTEIYTLSLHDALPISLVVVERQAVAQGDVLLVEVAPRVGHRLFPPAGQDRKSTRLNSSHSQISYAVFCLKKKKRTGKDKEGAGRRQASRSSLRCTTPS